MLSSSRILRPQFKGSFTFIREPQPCPTGMNPGGGGGGGATERKGQLPTLNYPKSLIPFPFFFPKVLITGVAGRVAARRKVKFGDDVYRGLFWGRG